MNLSLYEQETIINYNEEGAPQASTPTTGPCDTNWTSWSRSGPRSA